MMKSVRRLSIAICCCLLAAACRREAAPGNSAVDPPSGSAQNAAQEPATEPRPPWLTSDGWRDLRIGMTRQEVVKALGDDANPNAVGGPDPEQCDQFRPERAPEGMLVMIERGRLTRISVSREGLETEGGIEVGDPASAVGDRYGARVVSTPHAYLAAPAEYLTVWTTEAPAAERRGIVYEIGMDGLIAHIHAGGPSIQYVEGCL